VAKWRC